MTQTPAPIDDRFTRSADTTGLDALFAPRSIAILGASSDPTKIGGRPVRFVKESGFAGTVYPINPKSAEVQGLPAYPDIESVPGDVDLALVALPNSHVLDAVHACGRKGVKVVTIFSAGFAEMSEAGAAQQLEIVDTARSYGMRVLGPNCIGSMNRATGAVGTFAASVGVPFVREPLATVALASQSGAIASEWVVSGTQRGLQFDPTVFCCCGDQAHVDECAQGAGDGRLGDAEAFHGFAYGHRAGGVEGGQQGEMAGLDGVAHVGMGAGRAGLEVLGEPLEAAAQRQIA